MCQWGAEVFSERGYTYLQILNHYYNMKWYHEYGDGALVEEGEPVTPEPTPEVPTYDTALYVLLESISVVFFHIAGRTGLLADAVRNVPVIGNLFYAPLNFFSEKADDAWLHLHDLAVKSNEINRFVQDMVTGSLFNILLRAKVPDIGHLLADPEGWVRERINELLGTLRELRDSPTTWILNRIYDWFPWFRGFIDSPGGFVLEILKSTHPSVRLMIESPLTWFLMIFRDAFPAFYEFIRDPDGWVKAKIQGWLGASAGLWTNTWSYIWYKIQEVLNAWGSYYAPWFRTYSSKLLRYLLEGVWSE
jgi:hypothetical protein